MSHTSPAFATQDLLGSERGITQVGISSMAATSRDPGVQNSVIMAHHGALSLVQVFCMGLRYL